MKAMKKTLAVLLTVCMVVSMFALAAVTVSVGAVAGEIWSVMGSFNEWTIDYEMTDNSDGTYTVAIENVASGDYLFRVRKDHSWDVSYGKGDANYDFTVEGVESTTVTITFDSVTKKNTVSGEGVKKSEHKIKKIVVAGECSQSSSFLNGETWNTGADVNKMTEIESNVYQITYRDVAAGPYEFKFAANGSWIINWGSAVDSEVTINEWNNAVWNSIDNIKFTLDSEEDVTLVLDFTEFDPETNSGAKYKIIVGDEPEPSTGPLYEPGYYLVGKIGGVDTWSAKAENRLTVNTGNTDEYMIENVSLDADDQIKVAHYDGEEINVWYPEGIYNQYDITADGKYTIYFRPDGNGGDGWHYGFFYVQRIPVSGYSLGVGNGDISFNVFFVSGMNVNKARFRWTGPKETQRTQEADVINNTATCGVPAAEMTAPIVIDYSYDNGQSYVSAPGTQTVAALANEYIAGDYSDNAKALAKAILVYGAAAQKQFSFRENDLATQDTPAEYDADDIKTYDDEAVNVPDKAQMPDLSAYGLNYEGCTLLLQSTTSLRFYFTKTEAYTDDVNVTYGGNQLDLNQYGTGKYWYVEIPNIGAGKLDKAQMLAVTKGENTADLGNYSTLSYVKAALGGTDDTLKNTVRAFYGFYLAAQKYQRECN